MSEYNTGLEDCWEGAKVGAMVGVPSGAVTGARYGYNAGVVGSFGTGGWNAFITIPVTTVAGGLAGGALGGVAGAVAGCAGNMYIQSNLAENFTHEEPVAPLPTGGQVPNRNARLRK